MPADTFFLLIAISALLAARVGFAIGSRRKRRPAAADYFHDRRGGDFVSAGAWSPDYAVSAFQIDERP